MSRMLWALALYPLFSTAALADDYFEVQNANLQRQLGDVNAYCKTKFSASIDEASFAAVVHKASDKKREGLGGYCSLPLREIRAWCALGFGDSIGKDITGYRCAYKKGPTTSRVQDGVLVVTTAWADDRREWAKSAKSATGSALRHGAFSAAQADVIRNNQRRLKDLSLDLPRDCQGLELKWQVDWKSFLPIVDKHIGTDPSHTIWQECFAPMRALTLRCNKGHADLVKEQVKSYTCKYIGGKKTTLTVDDGAYVLASSMTNKSQDWFDDRLGDELVDGEFSVRHSDFIKEENADFKRRFGDAILSACSDKFAWEIDWKSFESEIDKRLAKMDKTSIYDTCGVPIGRLAELCRSDSKTARKVKKKIKSYRCVYGGKRKRKLSLKRGKLQYKVDFGAKDPYAYIDKFLVKKRIVKKRPPPKKLSPAELSKIRRILGEKVSPRQQCRRDCSKTCRGAGNKSRCLSRCRGGC